MNSILTSSESLIGRKAFTFNAAGVSNLTKLQTGGLGAVLKPENKIEAYITITDPLNVTQNNNFNLIGRMMPDVNGKRHYIQNSSIINGHSSGWSILMHVVHNQTRVRFPLTLFCDYEYGGRPKDNPDNMKSFKYLLKKKDQS